MAPRKQPYRLRYKTEPDYPDKKKVLIPSHGNGPRCRVDYNANDDGPWTRVQILRIVGDDDEPYGCMMPQYYAIPLILINKQLAFYEAQCRPDGTPLPRSSSCGIKQRELREYSYLWDLRVLFLQAVFDMNHQRVLSERWRYDRIHGFLHRLYRRFGHAGYHRLAYWRKEIKEGRVPYSTPDIAEMDWKAYLVEDKTMNSFLWNRVSQGYSRVVTDKPPFESWRAWRAGHREHNTVPYLTPSSSPAPSLSSGPDGVSAAKVAPVAIAESSSSGLICGANGYDIDVTASTTTLATAAAVAAAAAATATATASSSSSRRETSFSNSVIGSRRGVDGAAADEASNAGDLNEEEEELKHTGYNDLIVLRTTLTGPPNSQEWALPLPSSSSEPSQSQSSLAPSSSLSSSSSSSMSTRVGTSGQERFRERQISFKLNAPNEMELAVIRCSFVPMEDVKNFETKLEVAYAEDLSCQTFGQS